MKKEIFMNPKILVRCFQAVCTLSILTACSDKNDPLSTTTSNRDQILPVATLSGAQAQVEVQDQTENLLACPRIAEPCVAHRRMILRKANGAEVKVWKVYYPQNNEAARVQALERLPKVYISGTTTHVSIQYPSDSNKGLELYTWDENAAKASLARQWPRAAPWRQTRSTWLKIADGTEYLVVYAEAIPAQNQYRSQDFRVEVYAPTAVEVPVLTSAGVEMADFSLVNRGNGPEGVLGRSVHPQQGDRRVNGLRFFVDQVEAGLFALLIQVEQPEFQSQQLIRFPVNVEDLATHTRKTYICEAPLGLDLSVPAQRLSLTLDRGQTTCEYLSDL